MLEIRGLSVDVAGKGILRDIDLSIGKGEVVILFGPNGSGKSTLIKTIMGFSGYDIRSGQILFNGQNIEGLPVEERVRRGIGMMHQNPPKIRGVRLAQLAGRLSSDGGRIRDIAGRLSLQELLDRDINLGFSGGEMKRSELFQLILQNPGLLLLDEPESGVDLENISVMGRVLDEFLSQPDKSALIITHSGYILDYLKAKVGCVMIKGRFWCVGSPAEMFKSIREGGYEKCKDCDGKKDTGA